MEVLRTPDERFADLPGYAFEPHYVEVDDGEGAGLRIHYVDEGQPGGETVLLLHGEPSWSYLYRKMIPVIAGAGLRVVAPDLPGFGRSDKPAATTDYSYQRHVDWMTRFLDALGLDRITIFGQDWGGLIGLRLLTAQPDRFARAVVGNTGLPTGDRRPTDAFLQWQKFSREASQLPIGRIVKGGCSTQLSDDVVAAYDAPFPDDSYKAGARVFPALVPTSPDDPAAPANRAAWELLQRWEKPFLTAFSDGDPITRGGDRVFRERVPGAEGMPHTTIEGAGHFLQEDKAEELAGVIVDFVRGNVSR